MNASDQRAGRRTAALRDKARQARDKHRALHRDARATARRRQRRRRKTKEAQRSGEAEEMVRLLLRSSAPLLPCALLRNAPSTAPVSTTTRDTARESSG